MKNIFSVIATFSLLLLFSCSKEKSVDSSDPNAPGGGGSQPSGRLVKTVIHLGQSDSTVTNISYDGQGRFMRMWLGGTQNLLNDYGDTRVVRNNQGVITSIITKEEAGSATDSLVYTVHYNAGNSRYSSKVVTEEFQGSVYRDSIVYNYNANGQITEEIHFASIDNSQYEEWSKTLFSYTNGNLTMYKGYIFDFDTHAYVQMSQIDIEYDNKQSPLVLGAEGILLEQINAVSPNNVTRATVADLEDPSNNETVTYTYEYNNKNKPATGTITFQSLGLPIPITFYYN